MNTNELVKKMKASASIVALLDRLGHQPAPRRGREVMYVSMLRDSDSIPSFSVNDKQGVWYDHGSGEGGNIIDFGLAYWKGLPFAEIIKRMADILAFDTMAPAVVRPQRSAKSNYVVYQTKPLGSHPAITEYLQSRGVYQVGKSFLQEVYYYVEDDQGSRKQYFAAGWQNEQKAWEVRNRFFKGCMGPKAITLLSNDPKKVAVFEGFLDFLSWKVEHPGDNRSVIVLNAVTMLQQGISKSKAFSEIDLYFDRDPAGLQAASAFIRALPYATDRSGIYDGFNDYNDKVQAGLSAGHRERGISSRIRR